MSASFYFAFRLLTAQEESDKYTSPHSDSADPFFPSGVLLPLCSTVKPPLVMLTPLLHPCGVITAEKMWFSPPEVVTGIMQSFPDHKHKTRNQSAVPPKWYALLSRRRVAKLPMTYPAFSDLFPLLLGQMQLRLDVLAVSSHQAADCPH